MSLATFTIFGFSLSAGAFEFGYGFPSSRRRSTDLLCGVGECTGDSDDCILGSGPATAVPGTTGVDVVSLDIGPGLKFGENGFVSGSGSWYELGSTAVVTGTGGWLSRRMLSYGTAASREDGEGDLPGYAGGGAFVNFVIVFMALDRV
jgi:hypothetical protein